MSICPLCQEAEETILHMLHCPCDKTTEGQDIALETLADSLEVCGTHPDMVSLLIHSVETEGAPHKGTGRDLDISFTEIMDTQLMIGWDVVKYGLSIDAKVSTFTTGYVLSVLLHSKKT